jgi:thymidine phosphorylase
VENEISNTAEAVQQTQDILSDDKAVEQLRRIIKEVKEGKTIPWKEAKARLGAGNN